MHCFPDTFVLYRQISFTSSTQRSQQRDQHRSLVSCRAWLLGAGVLFCWLSGWLLSTEATSSHLAAGAKSVLAVCPRCCRCHSAPQQPSIVAVRRFKSWLRAPRAIRRRWKRSRCQFSSSQAALYQVLRIRFECAGTYLSTPTIVVRICDDNIFYKAGI